MTANSGSGTPTSGWEGPILALGAAAVVACEFIVVGLAPQMARDLDLTPTEASWFVTWFALGSAVMGPVAVLAARRLRADHAMVAALAPFAAGIMMPQIEAAWAIHGLRFVQGATLPLFVSVAGDALTRLRGRDDQAVAQIYLGVILGGMLGAPAGIEIADRVGWRMTFALLGAVAAGVMLAILARRRLRQPATVGAMGGSATTDLIVAFRFRVLAHLLLSTVLFAAMFCTYAFLGVILDASESTRADTSLWLLVFGAAGIAGNYLAGRGAARSTRPGTLLATTVIVAAAAVVARLPTDAAALLLVLSAWGAAHAACFVQCQVRVVRAASQTPRIAAALNISACNIGIAVGSRLGAWGLDAGGLDGIAWTGLTTGLVALGLAAAVRYGHERAEAGQHPLACKAGLD